MNEENLMELWDKSGGDIYVYAELVAQSEQEPVAWISENAGLYHGKPDKSLNPLPLYLAPPPCPTCEALAQPERSMKVEGPLHVVCQCDKCKAQPEPVAWAMLHDNGHFIDAIHPDEHLRVEGEYTHPLYTTPPQRKPLTDEEILDVNMSTVTKLIDDPIVCDTDHNIIQLAKAIEAKLKEKNT